MHPTSLDMGHISSDESFDNLDSNNKVNMKNIFHILKDKYEFVVIISHSSEIASLIHKKIVINVLENQTSKISLI